MDGAKVVGAGAAEGVGQAVVEREGGPHEPRERRGGVAPVSRRLFPRGGARWGAPLDERWDGRTEVEKRHDAVCGTVRAQDRSKHS